MILKKDFYPDQKISAGWWRTERSQLAQGVTWLVTLVSLPSNMRRYKIETFGGTNERQVATSHEAYGDEWIHRIPLLGRSDLGWI